MEVKHYILQVVLAGAHYASNNLNRKILELVKYLKPPNKAF